MQKVRRISITNRTQLHNYIFQLIFDDLHHRFFTPLADDLSIEVEVVHHYLPSSRFLDVLTIRPMLTLAHLLLAHIVYAGAAVHTNETHLVNLLIYVGNMPVDAINGVLV